MHTSKVSMSNIEQKESAEDTAPNLMQDHFKQWVEPIMQEFQLLKDTMSRQKSQITEEIGHLKMVMKEQKAQIVEEINVKAETNKVKISQIINENMNLCKENIELQDRVSNLESAQLTNNIIISGILEHMRHMRRPSQGFMTPSPLQLAQLMPQWPQKHLKRQ